MGALRPLRIAMFANTYLPSVNGVPTSIHGSREGLRRLGRTVYVFAPSGPGADAENHVFRYVFFGQPWPGDCRTTPPISRAVREALGRIAFDPRSSRPWQPQRRSSQSTRVGLRTSLPTNRAVSSPPDDPRGCPKRPCGFCATGVCERGWPPARLNVSRGTTWPAQRTGWLIPTRHLPAP